MIDQRALPSAVRILELHDVEDVARGIEGMAVRGAPAIGAAAAYGLALGEIRGMGRGRAAAGLRRTRPTGHDLFSAIDRVLRDVDDGKTAREAAEAYARDDIERCRAIGRHGKRLIKDGMRILTHCNAGALATVDVGTVMAPLTAAKEEVLTIAGVPVAPKGSRARNFAFDVTPARYITGFITDLGVLKPADLRARRKKR